MSEHVYLNGQILPAEQARVSIFDAGITHAAGLFETLRAYNGRIMRLSDHLDRMDHSAEALEMAVPVDRPTLTKAAGDVLEANDLKDARLRITLTPGPIPHGDEPHEPAPTIFITAGPPRGHPPELYRHGMRVCISPYRQSKSDPLAGHKTLAYLPRLMAMRDAAARKCHESFWFNSEGHLAEGSICNVFVVRDGKIMTPAVDTPILPGVVRKSIIEICAANILPVAEQVIDIDTLLAAQEIFITGSVLEVMPVTAIEKHDVADGLPGPITQKVAAWYKQLVARECGTNG